MTTIEERVASLEKLFQQGRQEHKDIAATLERLAAQVSKLSPNPPMDRDGRREDSGRG